MDIGEHILGIVTDNPGLSVRLVTDGVGNLYVSMQKDGGPRAERKFDLDDENERHWMEYNLDGLFAEVNGTYEPDEDLGQLYFPRMTVQGKPVNFGTPRFSFPPSSRKH